VVAKKFSDLRAKMSPQSQARARARAEQLLAEMPLHALRRARELSQATLAEILGATQPQVSKIEHSTDLYVSTLRRYVQAVGGDLQITAVFPEGTVVVDLFEKIETKTSIWAQTQTVMPSMPLQITCTAVEEGFYEVQQIGEHFWVRPTETQHLPAALQHPVQPAESLSTQRVTRSLQPAVAA
jgi:transcriptional regulator with XRE-family HTH domain